MKTPDMQPTEDARKLQEGCEVFAITESSCSNVCLSCCCAAPRTAHTAHVLGVLNYWVVLILMSICPCPMLWYLTSGTDLKTQLGGEQKGCCRGCLSSLFCGCCLVVQDAESLDRTMNVRTTFCGVQRPA
eukprot:TRINITY_DN70607_c0_g1_i2.p2 TRINITY_DN70607_c0_g1~~TRINITY_DN70607_c0_g1_i2.p2  ORF type:complete len:130 (+),score=22.26 TRINITY_DN70607_c0_g1_i2:575-964(+)